MPESQGAVPSGRCLPEPGESVLSPGNWGELGKCAGGEARLGRSPCHRRCLRGSEGAEGWCQGHSLSTTRRGFHLPNVCSDLSCASINGGSFSSTQHAFFLSDSQSKKKASFVLKFIELIGKLLWRNAYTSLNLQSSAHSSSETCIRALPPSLDSFVFPAGWSFPGDFHQSSGDR